MNEVAESKGLLENNVQALGLELENIDQRTTEGNNLVKDLSKYSQEKNEKLENIDTSITQLQKQIESQQSDTGDLTLKFEKLKERLQEISKNNEIQQQANENNEISSKINKIDSQNEEMTTFINSKLKYPIL